MSENTPTTTLVIGGTGKTGRRVAERLAALGVPVRIGSRSGHPPFDWQDRSTWRAAVEGASSAYIAYHRELSSLGAAETIGAFAELAVASGVRRLVLLSGRGDDGAQPAEAAVMRSGAEWTIVRPSFFAQNLSEDFLIDGVRAGVIAMPAGDVVEPFVDADDVADVAVAALTEPGHAGQMYDVTGPRLLSFADVAGEIAKASGHPVEYVPITFDEFASALAAEGLPSDLVAGLTDAFRTVLDGRNEYLGDGVQRVLGRRPRDFGDYARDTAATGIWTPS